VIRIGDFIWCFDFAPLDEYPMEWNHWNAKSICVAGFANTKPMR
jgi:hypothetical protein